MLILGIDPSLCHTGIAILETESQKILYKRTIHTSRSETLESRLHHIYGHIRQVIHNNEIKYAAIETQYMGKYSAALKVAMAYAVCLIACEELLVPISHYSPACIKKNITGIGTADKIMVINAVELIYGLKAIDSHMADAIAVAHIHHNFLN